MKVTAKQYAKLIFEGTRGLDESGISGIVEKVVGLIKKNKDQKKMRNIIREISEKEKADRGIVEGSVISARIIGDERIVKIKTELAKKHKTSEDRVLIENVVDKKIKGGMIIRIENEIVDGSLKNRINSLKKSIAV